MAVVNTKCNLVANLDASPPVMNHVNLIDARLREQVGTVEIAVADEDTSVYRLGRVHSSWRISEITAFTDAITSGAVFDVGFYDIASAGGAVINANAIGDNVSLTSASLTGTQLLFEGSSDTGVEDIEQRVWEMAGLTVDPGKFMDLCLTADTVGSGAGTVSLRTRYVAGS